MFAVNTPYYHVQAIRRQLQDKGIRTLGKPFYGYFVVCNLVTLPFPPFGETATGTVTIDADSYFVWISTSYFQQTDPITFDFNVPPADGEPFGNATRFVYSFRMLKSGRNLHRPEFIPLCMMDWAHPEDAAIGNFTTPVSIFGQTASFQASSFHGFRAPWPEPVLMNPGEMLEVRVRVDASSASRAGHLFVLNGVKLFPGGV